jgi:hypothetical protein
MGSLREAARDRDWRGGLGLAHSRLGSVQISSYELSKFAAALTGSVGLTRARGAPPREQTRRLLTNHPCQALSPKSPIPKERLRVSNWIVQGLYDYAVSKTVEL